MIIITVVLVQWLPSISEVLLCSLLNNKLKKNSLQMYSLYKVHLVISQNPITAVFSKMPLYHK